MEKRTFLLKFIMFLLFANLVGCANSKNTEYNNEVPTMEKRAINPWTWQNKYEFVQANEVTGAQRMLFCAGQISVDDDGNLIHSGDMEKQVTQIIKNLETLFRQSGMELSNVVRITYYTTDIKAFTNANVTVLSKQLKKWKCKPATSLIGVAALARPGCLVEFEVTAMAGNNQGS